MLMRCTKFRTVNQPLLTKSTEEALPGAYLLSATADFAANSRCASRWLTNSRKPRLPFLAPGFWRMGVATVEERGAVDVRNCGPLVAGPTAGGLATVERFADERTIAEHFTAERCAAERCAAAR